MYKSEYVPPRDIIRKYNVCHRTLRRWVKSGHVRALTTSGGRRYYNTNDIRKEFGEAEKETKMRVRYARVSSHKQKTDLERQIKDLEELYPDFDRTYSDIGSGLNWKRRGLLSILDRVHKGEVSEVVVMHKDRLCRFGSELVEWIFEKAGCKLVVHHKKSTNDPDNTTKELADDLIAVTTVFVARHHGNRAAKNRKRRKIEAEKEPEKKGLFVC